MATINFGNREITSKIVYFGASGAGCNANVERLWQLVQSKRKSKLHRFGPKERQEESWYFDFVPLVEPPIEGFSMSWRIYSLPGGIDVKAHRDEVIQDVDAVVFVADARPDRDEANLDHLIQLETLLKTIGLELSATPLVIQVHHADAPDARSVEEVVAELNPFNFPVVPAAAQGSQGIMGTFAQATSAILARVRDTLAGQDAITLTAVYDTAHLSDADVIRRHMENIQARTEATPHSITVDPPDRRPKPGPSIEIPFQPEEFIGSHPLRISHALVEGDRIRIDIDMERMGGGEQRQLTVWLVNRPAASLPLSSAVAPLPKPAGDRVFDYLPEDDEVAVDEPSTADLPGYVYGVLGIFGGITIGLLSAYLLGFWG